MRYHTSKPSATVRRTMREKIKRIVCEMYRRLRRTTNNCAICRSVNPDGERFDLL